MSVGRQRRYLRECPKIPNPVIEMKLLVIPILANLADNQRLKQTFQNLVDHWSSHRLLSLRFILVFLMMLLVLLCGLRIWHLYRNRHARQQPIASFVSVARLLGLDWPQQWILIRIARHQGLPSPLTLLLSAATLRHHAQRYVKSIVRYRRAKVSDCVSSVQRILFNN